MSDVAARGTTVLVSSHNLRELEDVCDHVGIMNHGQVLLERSLSELQDNTLKIQLVFADYQEPVLPEGLEVLHHTAVGRVNTYIIRGNSQQAQEQIAALNPLLMDAVPLTLEEIFIYELGGADYAVKDILLCSLQPGTVPEKPDPLYPAVGLVSGDSAGGIAPGTAVFRSFL